MTLNSGCTRSVSAPSLYVCIAFPKQFCNLHENSSMHRPQTLYTMYIRSRDSVVNVATSYGVRVPVGSTNFSSPRLSNRLWGAPNLLCNGYRGLFPRGQRDQAVKLTTHLQLVPRSRKYRSIHVPPIRLHTPVLNNFTFT
jgi:hypothetical protein